MRKFLFLFCVSSIIYAQSSGIVAAYNLDLAGREYIKSIDTMTTIKSNVINAWSNVKTYFKGWRGLIDSLTGAEYDPILQESINTVAETGAELANKFIDLHQKYKFISGIYLIADIIDCITSPAECLINKFMKGKK